MRFRILIALFAVACADHEGDKLFEVVETARTDCRVQHERAVAWLERNPISMWVGADVDRSVDRIHLLMARMKAECPLENDPWGNPYFYGLRDRPADDKSNLLAGVLTVESLGPDGALWTSDDIQYPAEPGQDR